MNTIAAGHKAQRVIDSAESILEAFQVFRDNTTDTQWEQICSNELLDELMSACMDLEAEFEADD